MLRWRADGAPDGARTTHDRASRPLVTVQFVAPVLTARVRRWLCGRRGHGAWVISALLRLPRSGRCWGVVESCPACGATRRRVVRTVSVRAVRDRRAPVSGVPRESEA